MIHEDIFIRHQEADGMAFVYTLRLNGEVVACGTVTVEEEAAAQGYYGGSQAMD